MAKSIKEIVREYLNAHDHDGLCNTDMDCGCGKDDLFPCDGAFGDVGGCEVAKSVIFNPDTMEEIDGAERGDIVYVIEDDMEKE